MINVKISDSISQVEYKYNETLFSTLTSLLYSLRQCKSVIFAYYSTVYIKTGVRVNLIATPQLASLFSVVGWLGEPSFIFHSSAC
jgi:hypothetical protein